MFDAFLGVYVCFPFDLLYMYRMWNSVVMSPDHCLFISFIYMCILNNHFMLAYTIMLCMYSPVVSGEVAKFSLHVVSAHISVYNC